MKAKQTKTRNKHTSEEYRVPTKARKAIQEELNRENNQTTKKKDRMHLKIASFRKTMDSLSLVNEAKMKEIKVKKGKNYFKMKRRSNSVEQFAVDGQIETQLTNILNNSSWGKQNSKPKQKSHRHLRKA